MKKNLQEKGLLEKDAIEYIKNDFGRQLPLREHYKFFVY